MGKLEEYYNQEFQSMCEYHDKCLEDIMKKNNIDENHAACFLHNFDDSYICREYNGGCSSYEECMKIKKKENSDV